MVTGWNTPHNNVVPTSGTLMTDHGSGCFQVPISCCKSPNPEVFPSELGRLQFTDLDACLHTGAPDYTNTQVRRVQAHTRTHASYTLMDTHTHTHSHTCLWDGRPGLDQSTDDAAERDRQRDRQTDRQTHTHTHTHTHTAM